VNQRAHRHLPSPRPFGRGSGYLLILVAVGLVIGTHRPGYAADGAAIEPNWARTISRDQQLTARLAATRFADSDPQRLRAFTLNAAPLDALLTTAPHEDEPIERDRWPIIHLPLPDGRAAAFAFAESPIMEPALAERYPDLRTYVGYGVDDPQATVRFDRTPAGLHAQILGPSGAVYIDPLAEPGSGVADGATHVSIHKRDYRRAALAFSCTVEGELPALADDPPVTRSGGVLHTFRLALAATREYTQFHGGTVPAGMAAITTAINRVTGIYETELGIRLMLVANNDLLIYTSEPDPYTNSSSLDMLTENQANIDAVIGSANYDIGHVFATGAGSRATLGGVCGVNTKAQGVSSISSPIGDSFYVDYVAHEMGHQFGAQHTFNGTAGFCGAAGQRIAGSAYEIGSGSTIMAYAGICATDDLQANSDPYFHHESFRQITNFINFGLGTCANLTATGNADPVVEAGNNYFIPRLTPFTLTAAGSDGDGDPLTYSWEQRNLGVAASVTEPDNGLNPLFRVWPPTASPARTFPRLAELLANTLPLGEHYPNSPRTLSFRVVARDNRAVGGGVGTDDMTVTIDTSAGPFEITLPNSGSEVWGTNGVVTWDVAGTDVGAVNTPTVDILLSTNGGLSFPITLAANTPNDGAETVAVAVAMTTQARVKVAAVGNVFFDVCDSDFTIDPPALLVSLPDGVPASVAPGVPQPVTVRIAPLVEAVVPGGGQLHYRADGGVFATSPLSPQGGELYTALLPRATCDDNPEFFISALGDGGTTVTQPADAPTNAIVTTVGVTAVVFADDFETDAGWTITNFSPVVDGIWERGVPVNDDHGDPPADFDGSGQCYLTENSATFPGSDVDNGTTTLTSPTFDAGGGATLSYAYWLNDDPSGPLGGEDYLRVEYATDAGATNWQTVRNYTTAVSAWRTDTIAVGTEVPASATFTIRFVAADFPPADMVEAAIDAVEITAFACAEVGDADFDLDGDVDLVDFAAMQACWTQPGLPLACEPGDLNGDDVLDTTDLDIFTLIISGP
jgi:hypothetical protein